MVHRCTTWQMLLPKIVPIYNFFTLVQLEILFNCCDRIDINSELLTVFIDFATNKTIQ